MWMTLALLACGRDCAVHFEIVDRDWCYVEQSVEAAERGDLGRARTVVGRIQGELPRASAVEGVLTVAPRRVSEEGTRAWCDLLQEPYDERCLRTRGLRP